MPAAVAAPLAPLPTRLLARTAKVVALLPHNVTSLLRALARLQLLPQPDSVGGVTPAGLIDKMVAGGMSPDISELAFQLKSCTILGLPQLAQTILASFTADLLRTIGDADAATLSSLLWSLLALREHEHPLLPACLTAVAGISFTRAQLPLVAESTLMLQLEAPAGLPPIPAELAMVAATAAAELSAVAAEAAFGSARQPGPTLREVSGALEHLGLRHGVQVRWAAPDPTVPQTTFPQSCAPYARALTQPALPPGKHRPSRTPSPPSYARRTAASNPGTATASPQPPPRGRRVSVIISGKVTVRSQPPQARLAARPLFSEDLLNRNPDSTTAFFHEIHPTSSITPLSPLHPPSLLSHRAPTHAKSPPPPPTPACPPRSLS